MRVAPTRPEHLLANATSIRRPLTSPHLRADTANGDHHGSNAEFEAGCGSSEGTGCDVSCGWDGVVVVAGFVDVVVFLGEVVAPVLLEVAVGFDGA